MSSPAHLMMSKLKRQYEKVLKHRYSAKSSKTESFLTQYGSMLMCFLSSGGLDLLNDPSDASALLLCSRCFSRREMKLAKRRWHELVCQKVTEAKAEKGGMTLKYCQDVQIVCPDKSSQQLMKGFDDDINKPFSFQDGKRFDLSPNHSSKCSDQNVRLSQKLVKTCEDKCSKIWKLAFVHMILSHLSSGFAPWAEKPVRKFSAWTIWPTTSETDAQPSENAAWRDWNLRAGVFLQAVFASRSGPQDASSPTPRGSTACSRWRTRPGWINQGSQPTKDNDANICPISGHFGSCGYICCSDDSNYNNGFFSTVAICTSAALLQLLILSVH